jgi:hypothetical protein
VSTLILANKNIIKSKIFEKKDAVEKFNTTSASQQVQADSS